MKAAAAFALGMVLAASNAAFAAGDHAVGVRTEKSTSPHTMTLSARHRTCQKNPKLRDARVEVQALTYGVDDDRQAQKLETELKDKYKKIVMPLFRDRTDVTRENIQDRLQMFMRESSGIHFEFRAAIVDFLAVNKETDPCPVPAYKENPSPR